MVLSMALFLQDTVENKRRVVTISQVMIQRQREMRTGAYVRTKRGTPTYVIKDPLSTSGVIRRRKLGQCRNGVWLLSVVVHSATYAAGTQREPIK